MAARSSASLCSSIIRAASCIEIGPTRTSVRDRPIRRITRAAFSTSRYHREEERIGRRYGTANEPPPHLQENLPRQGRGGTTDTPARPSSVEEEARLEPKKLPLPAEEKPAEPPARDSEKEKLEPELEAVASSDVKSAADDIGKDAATTAGSKPDAAPKVQPAPSSKPLETVLNMPPPEEIEGDKPPHLAPPPYVHHFDTYGLVRKLNKEGGFTSDQSTTIMKAVRTILADNMDLARRGLVSKSNVENETYLFRAACSELKTELENNRKGELEKNRTRRALLQHEVDILGQKISQEVSTLKDDLKGMFDDRKMAARTEQRVMENKVQELNYKITVALNSDAKTEVEGVRWVLTRRAATALGVSVLMILATLNYARYMTATQEKERKQHEEMMKKSGLSHPVDMGTQTDASSNSGEALLASEGVQ